MLEDEGSFGSQVAKLLVGIASAITEPRNATFVIQRDDKRGSNDMLAVDQYLKGEFSYRIKITWYASTYP